MSVSAFRNAGINGLFFGIAMATHTGDTGPPGASWYFPGFWLTANATSDVVMRAASARPLDTATTGSADVWVDTTWMADLPAEVQVLLRPGATTSVSSL